VVYKNMMLSVIYWPRVKPRSLARMERRSSAGRLLPSLRYDTLIHQPDDRPVFSVTAARGGDPVFLHYPHVDHAGRLFVFYHHERADVSRQFKEQIGSKWIWLTNIGTERPSRRRSFIFELFIFDLFLRRFRKHNLRKYTIFVKKISFVECLMILFYDSVERLINIHIIAVVVIVKSGIIANQLILKLLMSLSGLLGWELDSRAGCCW